VEPEPSLVAALSHAISRSVSDFRPQDMAQSLLAFAELGLCPAEPALQGLLQAIVRSAGAFQTRYAYALLCWHLAYPNDGTGHLPPSVPSLPSLFTPSLTPSHPPVPIPLPPPAVTRRMCCGR
jgi:hypothetical protein